MVVGVCIPWFGSRTEARRNLERRKQWQDHEEYLAGLVEVLGRGPVKSLMVMGDFNQTIGPGSRAPLSLQLALQDAFPPNVSIVTSELEFQDRRTIDHVALSDDLTVESLAIVSNMHEARRLTDHFGVAVDSAAPARVVDDPALHGGTEEGKYTSTVTASQPGSVRRAAVTLATPSPPVLSQSLPEGER